MTHQIGMTAGGDVGYMLRTHHDVDSLWPSPASCDPSTTWLPRIAWTRYLLEGRIDGIQVEGFGIESASEPFQHLFVLFMRGIQHRREELLLESMDPATVLWWARSLSTPADRVQRLVIAAPGNALHTHQVDPRIPEIIHIDERTMHDRQNLAKHSVRFVFDDLIAITLQLKRWVCIANVPDVSGDANMYPAWRFEYAPNPRPSQL